MGDLGLVEAVGVAEQEARVRKRPRAIDHFDRLGAAEQVAPKTIASG
jgi:hypothetical protein